MKSVPFVALALSLMATSALAQPRHWRDEGQSEAQPPRVEQPRQRPERPQPQAQPQAAPQAQSVAPPQARFQRGEGGGRRERPAEAPQAQVVAPPQARFERPAQQAQPVQPQVVTPDRRDFRGGRPDIQAVPAQPPQGVQRQWQGDPRQRDGRDRAQTQAPSTNGTRDGRRGDRPQTQQQGPATNGQWDGRRDGRDANRDNRSGGRDGRDWNRDGRSGSGDRNAWSRDPNGWNRDGGRGGWDRDHHGPQVRPDWARRDGRYDRDRNRPRYDERRYPHFFSFQQRFRLPYYVAPFGYYDYEWGYGDYLPWGWYGPNYWLENWWDFGLPPPPIGCEWVRVGRDAVLIDTFDGRVLSVARLLFW
jgi:Ni/Co efflux regulator RcnB